MCIKTRSRKRESVKSWLKRRQYYQQKNKPLDEREALKASLAILNRKHNYYDGEVLLFLYVRIPLLTGPLPPIFPGPVE